MDTRPALLYLVHRIPYPPNKGDKVRSFNILRQLARGHRVFLGTFLDDPADDEHVARLGEWCAGVHVVRLAPRLARLASLRGLATGEALSLPYYRDRGMRSWVRDTVRAQGIRRAVAFSGPMAQYLDVPGLERRIVDFCDVDSAKWTRYAADRRWPMSWLCRREGRRLLAFERAAAAAASASLFVTEAETELFRALAPESQRRVATMRNGVDAGHFSATAAVSCPYPPGGPVLLFTGAMDYWPNVDAVSWFAREIFPALRTRMPALRFYIVGMNPAAAVQALADRHVAVTGIVPDVRPYLAHADVVVAPMRIARGIQNKILEAMAMARAVVVSGAAAAALDAVPGREFEIAEAPGDYVARIAALLRDPARAVAMGAAARQRVVASYSWEAHLAVLDRLLDAVGDDAEGAAAGVVAGNRLMEIDA